MQLHPIIHHPVPPLSHFPNIDARNTYREFCNILLEMNILRGRLLHALHLMQTIPDDELARLTRSMALPSETHTATDPLRPPLRTTDDFSLSGLAALDNQRAPHMHTPHRARSLAPTPHSVISSTTSQNVSTATFPDGRLGLRAHLWQATTTSASGPHICDAADATIDRFH